MKREIILCDWCNCEVGSSGVGIAIWKRGKSRYLDLCGQCREFWDRARKESDAIWASYEAKAKART